MGSSICRQFWQRMRGGFSQLYYLLSSKKFFCRNCFNGYIYIYCNQQTLFIVYTYIFRVEFKSLCWDYVESILFIMTFIILYITFIMTFITVSTTSPFLLYLNFFVWNSGIIILPCKVLYAIRYWQVIRVKFFHLMFTYRDCTLW